MPTATGTFHVELSPGPPELGGAASRFELAKTFHGDIEGTGRGVMLSVGDPESGAAGYVALEVVEGSLDGHQGSFALQQFGQMHAGSQSLHYSVVPGSGTDDLHGITGVLHLGADEDGTHRYELDYEL